MRLPLARVALAAGIAALAYLGVSDSLSRLVVRGDPALAHRISPANARITARYAEEAFARTPSSEAASLPGQLARRALLKDATTVEALTVLGFQAQLRGDTAAARDILRYSTVLSRREVRPRIWAIEEAVERGDIRGALRHYDIALRSSERAKSLLFPVLASALAEPRIRAALLPVLKQRADAWGSAFLVFAMRSGVDPEGALALLNEGRKAGIVTPAAAQADLVNALAKQGQYDAAWRYYAGFRPAAVRNRSRDAGFEFAGEQRAVFDWQVGEDAALGAAILREGRKGIVDFNVPPDSGGVIVQQTQMLPPGRYVLTGRSRNIDQPPASLPYWRLTCGSGQEAGRIPVPPSATGSGRFAGRIAVPANCPVQVLALVARPTEAMTGVSGQIISASLVAEK